MSQKNLPHKKSAKNNNRNYQNKNVQIKYHCMKNKGLLNSALLVCVINILCATKDESSFEIWVVVSSHECACRYSNVYR